MDIANRLRAAMSSTHAAIEQLPVSQSLVTGTISRDDYRALLQQLLLIHEALEDHLVSAAITADFFTPAMARAEVIRGDLVALGADEVSPPAGESLHLIEQIHTWAASSPAKLLGALYVLEGSRMGSMFLCKPLAQALRVPVQTGYGLDYHLEGLPTRPQAWGQFKARLAQLPLAAEQWDDVVAGAEATMNGLYELYSAISEISACSMVA